MPYRLNGQNHSIDFFKKTTNGAGGLCLCARTSTSSSDNTVNCAKLVHRGSKFGGSGLFVRKNGIDYEAACYSYVSNNISRIILEDCGVAYIVASNCYFDDTGFYAVKGWANYDDWIDIDLTKPWTIAFKVKGTSETAADKIAHILTLSNNDAATYSIPGHHTDETDVLAFGMFSSGSILFRTHYSDVRFNAGAKTDWHEVKVNFYPRGSADGATCDFEASDNGEVQTGTTYFLNKTFSFGSRLSRTEAPFGSVIGDAPKVGNASLFNGYFKYLSISQDELGYSPYRRSTHKVLVHFD